MSRAFVKEDVDPPERRQRARGASGLPPGAANYMTARTARALRDELAALQRDRTNAARLDELQRLLDTVTVVEPPDAPGTVAFGARVTVRDVAGSTRSYTIVGVDELDSYPNSVSWISPTGRALLAADVRGRVIIDGETVEIVDVEYPDR